MIKCGGELGTGFSFVVGSGEGFFVGFGTGRTVRTDKTGILVKLTVPLTVPIVKRYR